MGPSRQKEEPFAEPRDQKQLPQYLTEERYIDISTGFSQSVLKPKSRGMTDFVSHDLLCKGRLPVRMPEASRNSASKRLVGHARALHDTGIDQKKLV
jgi:hypothetical protein